LISFYPEKIPFSLSGRKPACFIALTGRFICLAASFIRLATSGIALTGSFICLAASFIAYAVLLSFGQFY